MKNDSDRTDQPTDQAPEVTSRGGRGAAENAESTTKIEACGLTKDFESGGTSLRAMEAVDFTIEDGEFVSIVGPSGCGKSTLLRILAGLEAPTSGYVRISQADPRKPISAMVFQQESVFPWMSVRHNIGYGLMMRRVPKKLRAEIVDDFIKKVGLSGFDNYYPHQLSGGMKQRVAVARAFANESEILLMDEPFAALDEQNKLLLQGELLRIWEGTDKAVVFVTHSIEEAVSLSDRVLVMSARPGRIKSVESIRFARPRDIHRLRADPAFGQKCYDIWEQLRDEVESAATEKADG